MRYNHTLNIFPRRVLLTFFTAFVVLDLFLFVGIENGFAAAPVPVRPVYSPRRILTVPCLCSFSIGATMGPTRPLVVNIFLTAPYPLRSWYQMYTGAKGAGVAVWGGACVILTPIGCIPIPTLATAYLDGSATP